MQERKVSTNKATTLDDVSSAGQAYNPFTLTIYISAHPQQQEGRRQSLTHILTISFTHLERVLERVHNVVLRV